MKLTKFFKTIVISIALAASVAMAGFVMMSCGEENPNGENANSENSNKTKEIDQAVSAAVDFLTSAKDGGNYSSVSEYSDGRIYKFYTDGGKIKVEYNGTFYAEKKVFNLYKIYQADDLAWHKTNDVTDVRDPKESIEILIININGINNRRLWSEYDSATKTLTCRDADESITVKFDGDELILTFDWDTGTTTHTIKDVGDTTVTLPENIIDDTQI